MKKMMWCIAFLLFVKSVLMVDANVPSDDGSESPWITFLKQHNSLQPVAILVDDSEKSFENARTFMKNVFEVAPNARHMKYYFSSFSNTGITKLIAIPRHEDFSESIILNDPHSKPEDLPYFGAYKPNTTLVITAILDAANALPARSDIIVFVDRSISDKGLLYDTEILIQKNIKVAVVWGGKPNAIDLHLFEDLCKYSGGAVLMIKANSTKSPFINGGNSKILSRSNIQASSKITFTVGNDVKGLYFEFRPSSIQGTIVSPDGFTINIQNDLEVSQFGGRSTAPTARSNQELREIHLNGVTSATTKRVAGQWRIDLTGVEGENYDVDVFAVNDMDDELTTEASSTNISASVEDFHKSKHDGKIIFEGSNTNLSNASVKESENIIMDVEFWNATVFTKKEDAPPSIANMKGNMSSHAALNNGYSQVNTEVFQMPTLLINIVQGSELIIPEGGRTAVIVFKITNNKNTDLGVTLSCQDQRYILQSLKPWRLNLTPLQTATSTLTMSIRPGTYEDELTMYARTGSEVIEKKVIVDVGKAINDYTEPYMDYNFLSDCSRVIFSDCSQGTWTIEVEARDIGSGLLDVTSNPPGLYFPNGFVSGTKENVRGVYSDSCCNADIQLSATDRTNNRKVLYANAYRAAWSPAQISALVIGLILLIVIIIIIVLIVKKYRKKEKVSTCQGIEAVLLAEIFDN